MAKPSPRRNKFKLTSLVLYWGRRVVVLGELNSLDPALLIQTALNAHDLEILGEACRKSRQLSFESRKGTSN